MGEIIENCPNGSCWVCEEAEQEYEDLIKKLSQLHDQKSTDPETLYKSSNNHFNGKYHEILSMQKQLFCIALNFNVPWAKNIMKAIVV